VKIMIETDLLFSALLFLLIWLGLLETYAIARHRGGRPGRPA
jgi:hypothetical protein